MDLNGILQSAERGLWGPGTLALLLGTGLFLTVRTDFLPWKNLGWAMGAALGREARQSGGTGGVSPFSALMTSLAATIGTGNIVGVATALVAGGPGALVWMEVSAIAGLALKYAECMLAVKYRSRNRQGQWQGGPMYVMRAALGAPGAVLGGLYALFAVGASFGIGGMTQSNSIAGALGSVWGVPAWAAGLGTALLALAVVSGGVRGITRVCTALVPAMALFYLTAGLAVVLGNWENLPAGLWEILRCAISPRAAAGGAAGAAVSWADTVRRGISRGVFSNEAGLGSAAIAHAAADTKGPVNQGLYGIFEVFVDTIVICSLTALAIICSGVQIEFGTKPGSELIAAALGTVFGDKFAALFVAIALMLFAFSTVLGWSLYGTRCVQYLFGHGAVRVFQVIFIAVVVVGCVSPLSFVWDVADTFNGLMAIPNFIGLFALSGVVAAETKQYFGNPENLRK